ncbi:uncharacterized protein LY79DRAFT_565293 [Colletotrichum navitas]|uniref:Secreted protein n=1 Tax=Colletotrichum navitas TaxID=681940 RepID=A0AAD8V0X4_9PEZI|nr:uncharacterized protein LY79DRAFT_565293 [Colletotrichum navitas]KAK1574768.1 hypothetical protein LY79DRAFT_565293 [Colletotrichum navitas]
MISLITLTSLPSVAPFLLPSPGSVCRCPHRYGVAPFLLSPTPRFTGARRGSQGISKAATTLQLSTRRLHVRLPTLTTGWGTN